MRIEAVLVILCLVLVLCAAACNTVLWIGHDSGKAMRYQNEMKRYTDESGFCQDIYGYGWGK